MVALARLCRIQGRRHFIYSVYTCHGHFRLLVEGSLSFDSFFGSVGFFALSLSWHHGLALLQALLCGSGSLMQAKTKLQTVVLNQAM